MPEKTRIPSPDAPRDSSGILRLVRQTIGSVQGAVRSRSMRAVMLRLTLAAGLLAVPGCSQKQTMTGKEAGGHAPDVAHVSHDHLQKEIRESVHERLDALLHLDEEHPEEVFGDSFEKAFVNSQDIRGGKVKVLWGCIDERVPSPDGVVKIGVAGAGVLMTRIPSKESLQGRSLEWIYAYLADPISGDSNLAAVIESWKKRFGDDHIDVESCDHEGCGAVEIFCKKFEEATSIKLDPARVARAAVVRLHTALGLPGKPKHASFRGNASVRMNGNPAMHDGYARVVDFSGRFNPDKVTVNGKPMRALTTTVIGQKPDYLNAEVSAGEGILKGPHGIGVNTPVLIIGNPDDPGQSAEEASKKLAPSLKGQKVIKLTAPPDRKK